MNVNFKRTLLASIALSISFTAALSYSKSRTRWNMRMVADDPAALGGKTETIKKEAPAAVTDELVCRTGVLELSQHYGNPEMWPTDVKSVFTIPYLKAGDPATLNCIDGVPRPITPAGEFVLRGDIGIKCVDGAIQVTGSTCVGLTAEEIAARKAAEAAALAAQQAADAEAAKQAAAAAEAARIAAEQAAAAEAARQAAAAAAAAAAAQAAASAACPSNCGGATGSYRGGSTGKNQTQYTVTYQACNSGHKIVRSSGNTSLYAVGACYNSVPK